MRRLLFILVLAGCASACAADDDGGNGMDASPMPDMAADESWQTVAAVGEGPRQEHSVVALGGKVYVLGGFDSAGNDVALVERYDPETDTWETVAPMPLDLHHLSVAVHDGKIYVLGGLQSLSFTATGATYAYDPELDEWATLASMPGGSERGGGIAASVGGDLVVVGGLRAGQAVPDVSHFDPGGGGWSVGVALPEPLDHLSGGVIDGTLYIAGGRDSNPDAVRGKTYEYEPGSGWVEREPMITPRGGTAGAVHDGALYVFGGEGADLPGGVFPQVERYVPGDGWESLVPMPTARHGMGAAAVDGVIYVPGGGTVQLFGQTAVHEAFTAPPR